MNRKIVEGCGSETEVKLGWNSKREFDRERCDPVSKLHSGISLLHRCNTSELYGKCSLQCF